MQHWETVVWERMYRELSRKRYDFTSEVVVGFTVTRVPICDQLLGDVGLSARR